LNRIDAAVLAIVILAGMVNLAIPFDGDQALFTLGSRAMDNGAVLYRDFWDLKQPGIYGFYLVAGKLFGFTEPGIHVFELIAMAVFGVFLVVTLKGYYEHPILAALAPLLTIGVYYAVAGTWHLTQVEGLVGLPMYVCLWFASTPPAKAQRRAWRFVLSGAAGAVVLLFKLMFLPIIATFWLTAIINAVSRERQPLVGTIASVAIPVSLGLLVPLCLVVAYFAWFGTLPLVYQTFFEYPPRIVMELPASLRLYPLLGGLFWFVINFAPLTALALTGTLLSLRQRPDRVTVNLVLWCVVGLGMILLQRRSWWEYHYLLLFVPIGLLAIRALDVLWTLGHEWVPSTDAGFMRLTFLAGLLLMFAPVPAAWLRKCYWLADHRFALTPERHMAYRDRFNPEYRIIRAEVAFLAQPDSRPGDIYVCGSPLYYYESGRGQAGTINGWALELLLPEQWEQLARELQEHRPPYIFVSKGYENLVRARLPMVRMLANNYRELRRSNAGVWYELNEAASFD
jgi:hypothetical protein